jgi:hypothetical protein
MPLAVPFDYYLAGNPAALNRRVRIYRIRYKTNISSLDYECIAVALWTLSQNARADASVLRADGQTVSVSAAEVVDYDSPADIEQYQVLAAVGKARLVELSDNFPDSILCDWFLQEADLLDEEN